MTINRLNQGTTNQVLVKAISGQTTNLLELQDSSGNVVSSIGPTGALGGTVSQPQGLVHIETVSFTTVSSFQFTDGIITNDYDVFHIHLNLSEFSTTAIAINMNLRASGSDLTGTNMYRYVRMQNGAGATSTLSNTSMQVLLVADAASLGGVTGQIILPFIATASGKYGFGHNATRNTSGTIVLNDYGFNFTSSTAADSLKFTTSTGTVSGSASIYGMRK
jgi:hypothetical protein